MNRRIDGNCSPIAFFETTTAFLLLLLSLLFYCLYLAFSPVMHSIGKTIDMKQLVPWNIPSVKDGIELYVMSLIMPIYFAISFIIIKYIKITSSWMVNKWTYIIYFTILCSLFFINIITKEEITIQIGRAHV